MKKIFRSQTYIATLLISLVSFGQMPAQAEVSVIVNPKNPVAELSSRQLSKIFMGRLRMYPETEVETEVLDLPSDLPMFEEFYQKLVNMTPSKLKRYRASYLFTGQGTVPKELESTEEIKNYVSNHPGAIGYIDSSLVDASVKEIFHFD